MKVAPIKNQAKNQLPRRKILWLKSNKSCHWCGRATYLSHNVAPDQATVDHRIPRGRGGPKTIENCGQCNEDRNRCDMLSNENRGPSRRISAAEDLVAALGEASRQRDAAVQQLNAQLAWNRRYLADLQIFLNQRSAASR
jgi:hypothetical protein